MSYDGGSAEFLLANKHPAVKAVAPEFTLFDAYADIVYPGGIHLDSFTTVWQSLNRALDIDYLPSITVWMPRIARSSYHGVRPVDNDVHRSMLAQAIQEHDRNLDVAAMARQVTFCDDVPVTPGVPIDAFSPFSHTSEVGASGASVYLVDGWFDAAFQNSPIKCYLTLENPVRLILGPWNHGGWNNASPFSRSPKSAFNLYAELLRFFDRQLAGIESGVPEEKSVLYFTMGQERWKNADRWPPPGTHTLSLYLEKDQRPHTEKPTTFEASDTYSVDLTVGTV